MPWLVLDVLPSCGATLPVELSRFSALLMEGQVQLEWETQTEIGFDHFEVEYSMDGIDFDFLTRRNAKGTESSEAHYNPCPFTTSEW